jgi:hypothetical protein
MLLMPFVLYLYDTLFSSVACSLLQFVDIPLEFQLVFSWFIVEIYRLPLSNVCRIRPDSRRRFISFSTLLYAEVLSYVPFC